MIKKTVKILISSFITMFVFLYPQINVAQKSEINIFKGKKNYIEGEIIVKFKNHKISTKKIEKKYSITKTDEIENSKIKLFKSKNKKTSQLLKKIKNNKNIEFIQPNYTYKTLAQTTPWGITTNGTQADTAQNNNNVTGSGIVVAILDTGVDIDHEDLQINMWNAPAETYPNSGWDFVNNDNNPDDDHGHGTHVAGTVAAIDNDIGVVGVAPEAQIMAVKILDSTGYGTSINIAAGIDFASTNGANVINMSIGGYDYDSITNEAVTNAWDSGVVVISAAGNESENLPSYPASFEKSISVGAIQETVSGNNPNEDMNSRLAFFSNYGFTDIVAPGVNINSTTKDGSYSGDTWSGTSMATPHVSGTAALILEKNPTFTPDQVRQVLKSTATDLGNPGCDQYFGCGLINADLATASLSNQIILSTSYTEDDSTYSTQPTLSDSTIPADNKSTIKIKAYVSDDSGSMIEGETINFSSTAGVLADESSITDNNGIAEMELMASNNPGTATITATSSNYGLSTTEVTMADVLLVSDSGEWYQQNNFAWYYYTMLNDANINFVRWDTFRDYSDIFPSSEYMSKFDLVIWYTGDYYLTDEAQASIASFLDANGNVLITGPEQLYYVDHGSTSDIIYNSYLKAIYGGNSPADAATISGSGIFANLNFDLVDPGYISGSLNPDYISIADGGSSAGYYNNGETSGISINTDYKSIFLSYGIESVYYKSQRDSILNSVFNFITPITGVTVSSIQTQSAIVSWDSYTDSQVSSYTINYGTDTNAINIGTETSDSNSVTLSDLNPNTTYYVKVSANLASGSNTDFSAIRSFTTLDGIIVPTNLRLPKKYRKAKTVKLKWDESSGTVYRKIQIRKQKSNELVKTFTDVGNNYKNVKKKYLISNQKYKFRIKACDNNNCTDYSEYKNFRTKPAKIKKISYIHNISYITLKWKKIRGSNIKYQIKKMDSFGKKMNLRSTRNKTIDIKINPYNNHRIKIRGKHNNNNKGAWSKTITIPSIY